MTPNSILAAERRSKKIVSQDLKKKGTNEMAITVTVNGQSVQKYLSRQKSIEIQQFLRDEMFSFRYAKKPQQTSTVKNVSKVHAVADGKIDCR